MASERPELTTSQFLISAGLFEGGILLAAFVGGWLTGVSPIANLYWSSEDLALGVLATGPMLILLAVCVLSRSKGLVRIRTFLRDFLGPLLEQCGWHDLVLLALLAGVCEELFFRGFLYAWIQPWNPMLAVVVTNLLFGVAHSVTPMYALLAAFLGMYLTAQVAIDPTPNLLIPVVSHAVYDFVAFLVVLRDYRRRPEGS